MSSLKEFNPERVKCPNCKEEYLVAKKINDKVYAFKCYSCGSLYDVSNFTDYDKERVYFIAKRRNPECQALLNSDDIVENLKKIDTLEKNGIPFYSDTFILGTKKIE